jgi:hypothetical protein
MDQDTIQWREAVFAGIASRLELDGLRERLEEAGWRLLGYWRQHSPIATDNKRDGGATVSLIGKVDFNNLCCHAPNVAAQPLGGKTILRSD